MIMIIVIVRKRIATIMIVMIIIMIIFVYILRLHSNHSNDSPRTSFQQNQPSLTKKGCLAAALVTALKLCYVPFEAKGAREDLRGDVFDQTF